MIVRSVCGIGRTARFDGPHLFRSALSQVDQLARNYELGVPTLLLSAVPGAFRSALGVRIFQNAAVLLGGSFLACFFCSGTSILLARVLSRERQGEYGATYVCLSLYHSFATFCLEQILALESKFSHHQSAEVFETGTTMSLGFSLADSVVTPILAPPLGYSSPLGQSLALVLTGTLSLVLFHLSFWRKFLSASLACILGAVLSEAIERADHIRLDAMLRTDLTNV